MNKKAIMMRMKLFGEALNNEESVGNVVIPKSININGETRQVISGDTLKHQHTRNLRLLAEDTELCEGCKILSPDKNTKPKEENPKFSAAGNRSKNCIVDDVEGFMDPKASAKKESTIKFSFAIATEEIEYENILHGKFDQTDKGGKKLTKNKKSTDEGKEYSDENSQMIFYKPIRNQEYALTIQLDLDRIGFDDQNLELVITKLEQEKRQKKAIKAIKNMIIDMEGAMCSTRLPHIVDVSGIIVEKTDKNQVLSKYSALNDDFVEVNQKISSKSMVFNNIEEFCELLDEML